MTSFNRNIIIFKDTASSEYGIPTHPLNFDTLLKIHEYQKKQLDIGQCLPILIVLDDCFLRITSMSDKNKMRALGELFYYHRHNLISFIIIGQSFPKLRSEFRGNVDAVFFKCIKNKDVITRFVNDYDGNHVNKKVKMIQKTFSKNKYATFIAGTDIEGIRLFD